MKVRLTATSRVEIDAILYRVAKDNPAAAAAVATAPRGGMTRPWGRGAGVDTMASLVA